MSTWRGPIILAVLALGVIAVSTVLIFAYVNSGKNTKADSKVTGATPTSTVVTVLANDGFEDGLASWATGEVTQDGVVSDKGYVVDISHSIVHSGTSSAHIRPNVLDAKHPPSNDGFISTKVAADIFRGKRVRYSAYVRTEDEEEAGLWMKVTGTIDGKPTDPDIPMSWDNMVLNRAIHDTTDWSKYDIVLDVPQEADFLLLGLQVAYGQVWLDDVQLEIVDLNVPTTGRSSQKELKNLDFEQGLSMWETETANIGHIDIGTGNEMAHSGKLGAYIRQAGAGPEGGAALNYQTIYGEYYRDKKLQLSAYMNVDKAPHGASLYLWAYFLDSEGKEGGPITATVQLLPTQGSVKGWQRISITLDIPDRVWGVTFGTSLNDDGEVWIDDVQLEVLGPVQSQSGYGVLRPSAISVRLWSSSAHLTMYFRGWHYRFELKDEGHDPN